MLQPTLAGFTEFVRTVMGVPVAALPDGAQVLTDAYEAALDIVNPAIQQAVPTMYNRAVYNLGGDILLNYAADQTGQTFFASAREKFKILDFTPGVVQSTGDEGTNTSLVVPEAFKELTLANLQQLKTPYGRAYLAIAQDYGPSIWGVS